MDKSPTQDQREHIYALPSGTFLHEYEIRSILGHGGFGITYLAIDTLLNEEVAIKEYLPSYLAARLSDQTVGPKSESDREAFDKGVEAYLNEARTIARFRHPNVVQVRRYFELNGTGYIVLNRENGIALDKLQGQGPVPEAQLRQIFIGALAGLEIIHQAGVLHRDIKPSNIIVRPDGSPVLIDFGAAREFEMRQHSMTTIMSPGYAPPEQYGEGGVQGFWTDFYALGATLYQCISGKKPPDSLSRLQLSRAIKDPLIPAEKLGVGHYEGAFLRLIDWMLRLNERERPQTVADIRKYLGTPSDKKLNIKTGGGDGASRSGVKIIAALLGVLLLAAGGFYLWTQKSNEPAPAAAGKAQGLHADLNAAGYDRAKLTQFETDCGADCPKDLSAERAARMDLLRAEGKAFSAAKDHPERLTNYLQSCKACEFAVEAETQREKLYADQLSQAGFDRLRLEEFISACQLGCAAQYLKTAQARLEQWDLEHSQYRDAKGDAGRLSAYLESCSICAFRSDAEAERRDLNAHGPSDAGGLPGKDHPSDLITDQAQLEEIKDRLFEQNLEPGPPGSAEMANAIESYADKAGLSPSGQPTSGLLESLRKAQSLSPWAAIVFAKGPRKWGMAWNLATRREAIAEAQKRCGSDDCGAVLSFFGRRCGAFAISAQGWGMTWRSDDALARQSALQICEKHGQNCRVIGAVCADGSDRFP